jgi:hypothetical protein
MANRRERYRDVAFMVAGVSIGLGGSILSSLFLHGTAAAIAASLMVVVGIVLATFGWVDFQRDSSGPKSPVSVDMAVLRELLAVGRLMDECPPKDALGRIRSAQTDHDILDWRLRVERELAAWPSILDQFRSVAPDRFVLIASGSVEYAGLSERLKVLDAVVP